VLSATHPRSCASRTIANSSTGAAMTERVSGKPFFRDLAKRPLSLSSRGHTLLVGGFGGRSSISGNRYVSRERRGWAATPTPRLTECIGGGKKYNELLRFRSPTLRNTARGRFRGEGNRPQASPADGARRPHRKTHLPHVVCAQRRDADANQATLLLCIGNIHREGVSPG
jgi:hypothetical protein